MKKFKKPLTDADKILISLIPKYVSTVIKEAAKSRRKISEYREAVKR